MNKQQSVLLVDDDSDILEALDISFVTFGYHTHCTTQGSQVLSLVDDLKPDIIVLDVMLSGIDGRDICQLLKQKVETKSIPIIMISARQDVKESSLAVGADVFLPKPFDVFELGQVAQKLTRS